MDGDGGDGYGNSAADGPPEPDCPERKMLLRILLYFMVCVTLAIYVWQLLYDSYIKKECEQANRIRVGLVHVYTVRFVRYTDDGFYCAEDYLGCLT